MEATQGLGVGLGHESRPGTLLGVPDPLGLQCEGAVQAPQLGEASGQVAPRIAA